MTARLCCSYLRVYQPVDALSDDERSVVGRTVEPTAAPALGLLAPEECCEVYEKLVDGEIFFCPAHTRLRRLRALVAFERAVPGPALPLFFSDEQVNAARREIQRIERDQPGIRLPIVQSLWHVPPKWFVCFDDAERRMEHAADHPSIRYETTIVSARRRVSCALDTLTGGIVHPVIVGMMYELKEWLGGFDERAVLELDYASVATLFEPDDLADDHSAADVWHAIHALGAGDGPKAGLYYRRVNERWTRPRVRQSLN